MAGNFGNGEPFMRLWVWPVCMEDFACLFILAIVEKIFLFFIFQKIYYKIVIYNKKYFMRKLNRK